MLKVERMAYRMDAEGGSGLGRHLMQGDQTMRFAGSTKTTKYEMALRGPAGFFLHLGWTQRKTKTCLRQTIAARREEIMNKVNMPHDPNEGFAWDTKRKAWIWNRFEIGFTSNTKPR